MNDAVLAEILATRSHVGGNSDLSRFLRALMNGKLLSSYCLLFLHFRISSMVSRMQRYLTLECKPHFVSLSLTPLSECEIREWLW